MLVIIICLNSVFWPHGYKLFLLPTKRKRAVYTTIKFISFWFNINYNIASEISMLHYTQAFVIKLHFYSIILRVEEIIFDKIEFTDIYFQKLISETKK